MISYDFTKYSRAQLKKIPEDGQKRIIEKIELYLSSPDPLSFAKFVGRKDGVRVFRYRVGDWRIIFDWESRGVLITEIRHRGFKRIYRDF